MVNALEPQPLTTYFAKETFYKFLVYNNNMISDEYKHRNRKFTAVLVS